MMESEYYAKIKYIEDNVKDIIPVKNIVEFQENPNDAIIQFDKNAIYTVQWIDHTNNSKPLAIQICSIEMIHTEEELQKFCKKRGVFPHLHDSVIERYYESESSEDEINVQAKKSQPIKKISKRTIKEKPLKIDIGAQREVIEAKKKFLQSQTLVLKQPHAIHDSQLDTSNSEKNDSRKSVNMSDPIKNEESRSAVYLRKLEEECEQLKTENLRLRSNNAVLNERIETYRILNERLQINILKYDKEFEELAKIDEEKKKLDAMSPLAKRLQCSTPQHTINNSNPEVSPIVSHKEDPKEDINNSLENRSFERTSQAQSPFDDRSLNNSNNIEIDDISLEELKKKMHPSSKKKLDFHSQLSPTVPSKKPRFYDEETEDSGIVDIASSSNVRKTKLSSQEFRKLSAGLFKTKHKDSTNTNGSIDDSVNDESSYFCNFGHKETGTNSDDVTTTHVWLNKEKKILLDEWKNGFKSKDPSKYVKYMLRLLHTDENGGYEENLSKKCVSSDKPSYTPRGMNRRVPLTLNEHLTLEKCLKTYLNKTSKLTSEEANKIIAKKNAFITEEINTCVKNQKKKLNI